MLFIMLVGGQFDSTIIDLSVLDGVNFGFVFTAPPWELPDRSDARFNLVFQYGVDELLRQWNMTHISANGYGRWH